MQAKERAIFIYFTSIDLFFLFLFFDYFCMCRTSAIYFNFIILLRIVFAVFNFIFWLNINQGIAMSLYLRKNSIFANKKYFFFVISCINSRTSHVSWTLQFTNKKITNRDNNYNSSSKFCFC